MTARICECLMLRYAGTDSDGRLNASQERGSVYNDFVPP